MDSHILITSAIDHEISYLFQNMNHTRVLSIGNRKVFEGDLKNHNIRLMVSGPGMVNTIQAMTACIENSKPSLIIQTGCAGAFLESGLTLGDIGIASDEVDIHLGIEPVSQYNAVQELPFPVLIKNNTAYKNRYECHKVLTDSAYNILVKKLQSKRIQVKKGPFITVSTITSTEQKAARLFHHYSAIMEAMEGAGAAHLSMYYDIPFLEIRAVSNIVGEREKSEWNLPLACERSNDAVMSFLESLDSGINM
jgi:futalosine hydrolase